MSSDHAQSTPVTMAVVPAEVGEAMLRGRTMAELTAGIVAAASATAAVDAVAMRACVDTIAEAATGTDAEANDADEEKLEEGRWPESSTAVPLAVAASAAEAAAESKRTGTCAAAVF